MTMMPTSVPPIDLAKQKVALTFPKLIGGAAAIAVAVVAYTQLATRDYVDKKHADVTAKLGTLADAQTESAEQIKSLAESAEKQKKQMGLVVRLVSAQYVDRVDAEEHPRPRQSRPRSARAVSVARSLKLDPDDPLAGLELTEMLEDK